MTVKITIDMNNDAFSDSPYDELSRILTEFARRLKSHEEDARLPKDINGNTVGSFEVEN